MSNFFQRLQQRNVVRAAITYVVVAWAIIQVCDILFPAFDISQSVIRYVLYSLIGLFPVWITLAYVFEWTPKGFKKTIEVSEEDSVKRQTGKRLNSIIIGGLITVVLLLVIDRVFDITGSEKKTTDTDSDKSIAVLPFVNMSNYPEQEYFSDGLSEELLNLLAKIPDLKVIARTSSFAFKGKNEDLRTIAEKLGVAHVLEGSVRKSGDKLRITAQLIRASDGTHLWSDTYDRTLDDIFKVQDEISAAVVTQLKLKLLKSETTQPKAQNVQSYNLWLEGNYFNEKRTKENYEKALEKFKAALAIDSTFAPAWSGLSTAYSGITDNGYMSVTEGNRLAKHAVNEALRLNPQLASAYAQQGWINMAYDWDWVKADANFKKALELEPQNVEALYSIGRLAQYLGRYDEAIALRHQAITLSPLMPRYYAGLSLTCFFANKLPLTEANIRKALTLDPTLGFAWTQLAILQLVQGKPVEALESIQKETSDIWKRSYLPEIYFKLNRKVEADAALKDLIEKYGISGAYQIAEACAYRNEIDKAFQWLDTAYQQRDGGLPQMRDDPLMKNLFNDPRWSVLLKKMKLD